MDAEVWAEGWCFKRGARRCEIARDMVQQEYHWEEREEYLMRKTTHSTKWQRFHATRDELGGL